MKKTSFQAEISKRQTRCKVCKKTIDIGIIRIKIHSYDHFDYYHFECYTPKIKQYISKSDLGIRLDQENAKILDAWLENWNKDYVPLDKAFHETPTFSKLVETAPSKYRRAWLEIFKFLDAVELFKIYSHVNKEFYHISWDEELWHFYCVRDYTNAALDDQKKNYRTQYIILRMESCFWCHAHQSQERFNRCPLIGKPICEKCKKLKRFEQLHKSQIESRYGINPNLLQLKFGLGYWNKKVVYRYMVEEALETFRNRNKEFLLEEMKKINLDPTLVDFVENIDIKTVDKPWSEILQSSGNLYLLPIHEIIYNYIRDRKAEKKLINKLKST
ncbi:unnamed protein product [Blepharisma stoltei]|uniref:PARP-type domain-containing protein n=1 Tax=Blepharisma stoltei TaxID=1481888 RepID=A0AAU9JWA9_9CILI|nr:unnamed protein product [Blepharisma stoltei]